MNGKIKITLLDFDNNVYVLYANGREELNKCLEGLGDTKWKASTIKPIK